MAAAVPGVYGGGTTGSGGVRGLTAVPFLGSLALIAFSTAAEGFGFGAFMFGILDTGVVVTLALRPCCGSDQDPTAFLWVFALIAGTFVAAGVNIWGLFAGDPLGAWLQTGGVALTTLLTSYGAWYARPSDNS